MTFIDLQENCFDHYCNFLSLVYVTFNLTEITILSFSTNKRKKKGNSNYKI